MANTQKSPANLLDAAERSAREGKREERIKPVSGTETPVQTRAGETVGTLTIAHYHPKKGEPVPVAVEKQGGAQRMFSLVSLRSAALAYGSQIGLKVEAID